MTIRQNIQAVINQIQLERATGNGQSATGDALQTEGQAAIIAGQGNPAGGQITGAWRTFMRRFAATSAELARLLPEDGTHTNINMQEERAYLIANSTCGGTTTDNLLNGGVTEELE